MAYLSSITGGASGGGAPSGVPPPPVSREEPLAMSRLISNLIEAMAAPSSLTVTGTPPPPPASLDSWPRVSPTSPLQNPIGTIGREYHSNNNHHLQKDDDSGSPGTSSTISIMCFRCEERSPTTRCLECNDLFCHDCCHAITSDCQLRDHTLLPIRQISPIGVRSNSLSHDTKELNCERHAEPIRFYCESCSSLICQECTLWMHKDHKYNAMTRTLDTCRLSMLRALESGKAGTKAVKGAIDRAVAISKAFEKETTDVSIKIKKAMRSFIQAIEEREKYLLERVEKMRQMKLNELSDQMNSLRGVLAGLAHTNETLVKCLDLEGRDLYLAKEKGIGQIEYYATMYKTMQPKEDKIIFVQPDYDIIDKLKVQCDIGLASGSQIQAPSMQALQHLLTNPAMMYGASQNYQVSGLSTAPDYGGGMNAQVYYDVNQAVPPTEPFHRGVGQAIPGYWYQVSVKPTRSSIPGVPALSFGREGPEEGQVSRPWGLCVDRENNIIVADRRNNRIQIFDSKGKFKRAFGRKGTGNGEFDLPAGITTDNQGNIIVIDKDNHRVQIFTLTGQFVLKFGSFGKECGQFQYPWDVAVNSLGCIVVTDTRNHRIQMFTSDGVFLSKFVFEFSNNSKQMKGPTTPRGVCFTSSGNIIVSDFENHRLIMVDPSLRKVIHAVGREGSGLSELNRPSGIVCDDEGRVIVADSKNHRVMVYTADLRYLYAVGLKSPGLDDKDRPCDVALTLEGYLVVLFETLPDTARDCSPHGKQYIKVY